jgi:hypothetical protein
MMKLSFTNWQNSAAEIASLRNQLESAKRRITELTLDNIQKANEIAVLQDYRGTPADFAQPVPANSERGRLFDQAS